MIEELEKAAVRRYKAQQTWAAWMASNVPSDDAERKKAAIEIAKAESELNKANKEYNRLVSGE